MIKCKCGYESSDGSAFCCNCGLKLEIACASCGNIIPASAKFCSNCGASTSPGQSKSSGSGEGNIIAGDVTGSYNTNTTNNTSIVNNIYQQAPVEKDEYCFKCDTLIPASRKSFFQCHKCGEYFCAEHMNTSTHTCHGCNAAAKQASLTNYIQMVKTRQYSVALQHFESEISLGTTNDEIYYYAAICLLNGKKAFLQDSSTVTKALKYISAAIQNSPKGKYYYYMAYLKYDFFERKSYDLTPNYREALRMANLMGISESEKSELFALLSVPRPSCL